MDVPSKTSAGVASGSDVLPGILFISMHFALCRDTGLAAGLRITSVQEADRESLSPRSGCPGRSFGTAERSMALNP